MSADAKMAFLLVGAAGVFILYRIYLKVKAMHFIMLDDFKRRWPAMFEDEGIPPSRKRHD